MKLPEIKNNHLVFLLLSVIVVLGACLIYTQYRQTQLLSSIEMTRPQGKDKDDPYNQAVKNQILKSYPAIKKLYRDFTDKNPARKDGNVVVDWSVDTDGKPEHVEIVSSDLDDRELEAGIVRVISKITFPEPPVKRYVTHTFRFKDVKGDKK